MSGAGRGRQADNLGRVLPQHGYIAAGLTLASALLIVAGAAVLARACLRWGFAHWRHAGRLADELAAPGALDELAELAPWMPSAAELDELAARWDKRRGPVT